ncbi:hypothetical protein HRbin36_02532 [bacterium HR36]|nr:hypothetical protein HRbin36_02532 [bacterium HR36]
MVAALQLAWASALAATLVPVLRRPEPERIQAAVRHLLQGIIFLDAFLAFAFAGGVSLLMLVLWPLAVLLGRWFAPT